MIINQNLLVGGQTYFSGERVPQNFFAQQPALMSPMTWLHEHQCALRLALETYSTTPTYNPRTPEVILGNIGEYKDINTLGQNTPAVQ